MTSYKRTFVPQIDARDCVAAFSLIAKFLWFRFLSSSLENCKDQ